MSDLDSADRTGDGSADRVGDGVGDGAGDRPDDRAVEAAADELGVSRETLLKRAIVALAESEGIEVPDADEVAAIEDRLAEVDAEFDEKVTDLRERFVGLYRDLETKAPADHTHEETRERLDAVAADLDERLARVESDLERLDGLESRVDGFDIDDLDDKLSRVASAVVRVRRRLEAAERDRGDREQVDALTAAANRHGVRKAKCTNCGETVGLGLLRTPECPHCGRRFADLEPNPGFLGTSRLVAEDPPALDGDVDGEPAGRETEGSDPMDRVSARDDHDGSDPANGHGGRER